MKGKVKIKIDVLTLFPKMFEGPLTESMLKRAQEKGILKIGVHNIRDFATDKHRTTDDFAYGGGGMVFKPEPIFRAVEFLKKRSGPDSIGTKRSGAIYGTVAGATPLLVCDKQERGQVYRTRRGSKKAKVILMTPVGKVFTQKKARQLARGERLIFICGHYEGVDERIRKIVDEEISIGDYVLTGGELPAMVVIDAIARMIKGVVGREEAPREDSFYKGVLDYPHYTRPREFRGMKVPKVLFSGNHKKIREWRFRKALQRTKTRRPDLLK